MTAVAALIILQWLALLGLAAVVLGLARQVGVLHQRLGPAGALMLSSSITVGEPSPEFRLSSLEGADVRLGGPEPAGRSTLVMFVAPDCPVCAKLIPVVLSIARAETRRLKVVFASDGEPAAQARFRTAKGLDEFPYVLSPELGMRYGVAKLPYAVLLDPHGVVAAQGLVNSREHLESLFEAQTLKIASIQDYFAQDGRRRNAASA